MIFAVVLHAKEANFKGAAIVVVMQLDVRVPAYLTSAFGNLPAFYRISRSLPGLNPVRIPLFLDLLIPVAVF